LRNGYVITSISPGNASINPNDVLTTAVLTRDGKLLTAGFCISASGNEINAFEFCAARYELAMINAQLCTLDIDGDGEVKATTDGLINLRAMLGIRGDGLLSGITFATHASRTQQCAMNL
jgi:hypothetical protein